MKHLAPRELALHVAPLHQILKLAGAHDWTHEQIEAHKAKELAKAPPPSWAGRHFFAIWRAYEFLYAAWMIAATVSLCGAVLSAGACLLLWPISMVLDVSSQTGSALLSLIICSCVFMFSGAMWWLWSVLEHVPVRVEAEWFTNFVPMSLGGMNLPPLAVALIGAARTAKVENHKIKIHELRQGYITLDPILEIDGRFVLVWDERGTIIPPPS